MGFGTIIFTIHFGVPTPIFGNIHIQKHGDGACFLQAEVPFVRLDGSSAAWISPFSPPDFFSRRYIKTCLGLFIWWFCGFARAISKIPRTISKIPRTISKIPRTIPS